MNKALNNPLVVGALAVIAAFVVYRAVFKKPVHAAPPPAAAAAKKDAEGPAPMVLPEIDRAAAGWAPWPGRDPFNAREEEEKAPEGELALETNEMGEVVLPEEPSLMVSALWVEGERRLAVINGQIVAEGESLLGRRLVRVDNDGIVVAGREGEQSIAFYSGPRPTEGEGESEVVPGGQSEDPVNPVVPGWELLESRLAGGLLDEDMDP